MIRGQLRGLSSIALEPDRLEEYAPPVPTDFGILVDAEVGPENERGSEWFSFTACSPAWLASVTAEAPKGFEWVRHRLVIPTWDLPTIRRAVEDLCRQTSGETWLDVATKLSRFMMWEFEDYKPHSSDRGGQ